MTPTSDTLKNDDLLLKKSNDIFDKGEFMGYEKSENFIENIMEKDDALNQKPKLDAQLLCDLMINSTGGKLKTINMPVNQFLALLELVGVLEEALDLSKSGFALGTNIRAIVQEALLAAEPIKHLLKR